MTNYDKLKVREQLALEHIFELLNDFGADPEYTSFGIVSATICHNEAGCGSRKLYYYSNTGLFRCFTQCLDAFDPFELVIKVFAIQKHKDIDLNDAVRYVAARFGISGDYVEDDDNGEDWKIFDGYLRTDEIELKDYSVTLKEYDDTILSRLNYNCILKPWLDEGITQEVIDYTQIGYYPGADQITIPHFDKDGRFVGLRGRSMAQDDIDRWGKYRPLRLDKDTMFNHPLGMNLYGLNWAKDNIKTMRKAIVFESEKAVLQAMSFFGPENSIYVACCGSNLSAYQVHMLMDAGAEEIVIGFDRQFKEIGDEEHIKWSNMLTRLNDKYKNDVIMSFIFDLKMITGYKDSPTDKGKEIFLQLFKERIVIGQN